MITKREFKKHILFAEFTRNGKPEFDFLGAGGWVPCNFDQQELLHSIRDEFMPAAPFLPEESRGGADAFKMFIVPGLLKPKYRKKEMATEDPKMTLDKIEEILWPGKNPDFEWEVDTLEEVARVLIAAGRGPAQAIVDAKNKS